jgi:hypothetical protein
MNMAACFLSSQNRECREENNTRARVNGFLTRGLPRLGTVVIADVHSPAKPQHQKERKDFLNFFGGGGQKSQ